MFNLSAAQHRSLIAIIKRTLGIMLLASLAVISSSAQTTTTTSTTDGMTPLGLAPGSPAGSYALSGFDTISPFSQSLNFRLPLMQIGGRGSAGYTMTLPIEKKWHVEHSITDYNVNCPMGGCEVYDIAHTYTAIDEVWDKLKPGYGPGVLQGRRAGSKDVLNCGGVNGTKIYARTLTRLTFTGGDGTEYELRDKLHNGKPLTGQCPGSNNLTRGTVFVTADGTSATFISDTAIEDYSSGAPPFTLSGYLLLRDGTRYRIDGGYVISIRDRNGNVLKYEHHVMLSSGVYGTRITDSLGRVVTITYASPTRRYDEIIYKGFGGAARTVRVWYDNLYNNRLRPANNQHGAEQPATYQSLFSTIYTLSTTASTPQDYNPEVVSAVELPDEQRRYNFYYNSYGELARVELPTGGAFEYDYQLGEGVVEVSAGEYEILRRVVERRVYNAGGALEGRTKFGPCDGSPYPTAGSDTCTQIDQRDPVNGNVILESSRHSFYGNAGPKPAWFDPLYYSEWNEGKEFITEAMATDGTPVLRRTEQTWRQKATPNWWSSNLYNLYGPEPANDPRLVETKTTLLDTNQVTKKSAIDPNTQAVGFDQFNNQTDVWEYDYGQGSPGALIRHTHTDYADAAHLINGIDYTLASNPNSVYLLGLPVQKSVYDINNVERARTTFEYDNYMGTNNAALVDRPGISGLCTSFDMTSNQCSNSNPYPTSYQTRGNVTRTSVWLLQNNQAVSSYAQYDVAGNVVRTIDPRGYATTLDYTDCYGTPDGEARLCSAPSALAGYQSYALPTVITNALGHAVRAQYDYYLGRAVDGEDANGVVSSGYYNDVLDRPTQVVRAANTAQKSQTTFLYNDAGRSVSSTSDQNSYGDNLLRSETLYDTLGRSTESRQYESQSVYITTRQSYDALGRVKQASNPFRSGETVLWTTTQYDALGRAMSVTTPDSAVVSTSYSGTQVTVTDQAGKSRRSTTDALGRLLNVVEDPAGLAYQTSYSYDVLDNLSTVSQGVQTRSFSYDSLKRLASATNPESGTINYQYDPAGNLTQKTDARGVVTTYGYDALSRATSRTYSDGTPNVTYTYDAAGIAYSKGKLTSVSSSVSATNYTGFDAMGRVTANQQVTAGQTYQMGYGYNLAGALTTETYPSGRVVSTVYDAAGRISTVSGQKSGEAAKTYASQFSYASHGALQNMTLGNSLTEQTAFNSRLQPLMIKLATPSNQSMEEMHYYSGGADNNGNVLHHTTVVDGVVRQQVYEYDQLNRLKKGYEVNQANGVLHWQQVFTYDRYGNRNFDVAQTTPAMLGSNLSVDQTTNRYTAGQGSILYDAAGNVTRDFNGHTFAYDGENKQTSYDGGAAADGTDYRYDGDGRRVKKINGIGQATTIFVYDAGGQLVAEYSTSTPVGSGGTSYLTSDTLGTPRVITDASGAVKSRHDYLPFGEEISVGVGGRTTGQKYVYGVEDDGVRQKFTQYERDVETGLDYAQNRFYASAQGRYMSIDPMLIKQRHLAIPQDLNRYTYVANNPLKYIDPAGLEKIEIIIRTFIPAKTGSVPRVPGSALLPPDHTFKGDDRKVGEAGTYRTQQVITIETDQNKNGGSPIYGNPDRSTMPTIELWPSGNEMRRAQSAGNTLEADVKRQGGFVTIQAKGDEGNPLIPSPGITYDFNIGVQSEGANGVATFHIQGEHDGYPGYEILVVRPETGNNTPQVIYGHDARGQTPLSLFPPTEFEVNQRVACSDKGKCK